MNLVLDSNIFISGLITPNGTISKLILRDLKDSILICPEFLLDEILSKIEKIKEITKLDDYQLNELIFRFIKRIDLINNDLIDFRYQKQAYDLVKDIDKKDLLFVALSIQTGFKLWTGDKKLTSKIKQTNAWKKAENEYSFIYADNMLPPQFRLGSAMTNEEFIEAEQRIIGICPSFYPAYFDMGVRLLSVNTDLAVETLDTAFEICVKINSWDTISKVYDIFFDNLEKVLIK